MTLRADVHTSFPERFLGTVLDAAPDARFEVEYQATSESVFVSVDRGPEGTSFETIEDALDEDPTVVSYRRVIDGETDRMYAVEIGVDRTLMSEISADLGINVLSTWSAAGDPGWTFELEVPDREALVELRSFWQEHGLSFDLQRLFYQQSSRDSGEFGLSDTQRETLLAAAQAGYFDVPRGVSQRELAESLDASPTAVSQRVRRAVRTLIENTLEEET